MAADSLNPLQDIPTHLLRQGAARAQNRVEMLRDIGASEEELREAEELAARLGKEAGERPYDLETEDELPRRVVQDGSSAALIVTGGLVFTVVLMLLATALIVGAL